jgi:hypothetical protein
VDIWQQVLGIGRVSIYDNFFQQGGNSLLILELLVHLNKIIDQKIKVITLFEYPTIRGLLEYIKSDGKTETIEEAFTSEDLVKELEKFQ